MIIVEDMEVLTGTDSNHDGVRAHCYSHSFVSVECTNQQHDVLVYISNREATHGERRNHYLEKASTLLSIGNFQRIIEKLWVSCFRIGKKHLIIGREVLRMKLFLKRVNNCVSKYLEC